jgi:hypothetical protein
MFQKLSISLSGGSHVPAKAPQYRRSGEGDFIAYALGSPCKFITPGLFTCHKQQVRHGSRSFFPNLVMTPSRRFSTKDVSTPSLPRCARHPNHSILTLATRAQASNRSLKALSFHKPVPPSHGLHFQIRHFERLQCPWITPASFLISTPKDPLHSPHLVLNQFHE